MYGDDDDDDDDDEVKCITLRLNGITNTHTN